MSEPIPDGIIVNAPALSLPKHFTAPDVTARAASDPRHSVWVNASAGSGKTTILTRRVTRLLLAGVPPHKILCLTFTRAAAAEMSLRLARQLSLWATCDEATLDQQLAVLEGVSPSQKLREKARRLFAVMLACPGGMRIRTIHAFCQEILGRFPIESGVTPHVKMMEEEDATTLRRAEMNRLLTDGHDPALRQAFGYLLDELGEAGLNTALDTLRKDAGRLHAALLKHGTPAAINTTLRHNLDLNPGDTIEGLLRAALSDEMLPLQNLRAVLPYLLRSSETYALRGRALASWLALDLDARVEAYDIYRRVFLTGEDTPYSQFANKPIVLEHPEIQTIMNAEATRILALDERLEALRLAGITAALITLHNAIEAAYKNAKTVRGAVDYGDLIHHTRALLQREHIGGWVMYKLDGGIDHILVDEAQDTSQAQWDIVRLLSEEFFAGDSVATKQRTLFVVGDEKQSIYSFQNADPDAFEEMRDYFSHKLRACGQHLHEIDLHVSFRSAPAVLRLVDTVFAPDDVRRGVARHTVSHQAALPRTGEAPKMGRIECWPLLVDENAPEEAGDLWRVATCNTDVMDAETLLAQKIASTIKAWLTSPTPHPALGRRVRPDDVMILLRTRGGFADLMVRALKKYDVPVTGVDRMHLVKQLPVMDLLALIQFILLPEDDLTLACLLRSPLLGVSEHDLMYLALPERQHLWQALRDQRDTPLWKPVHDYLAGWLSRGDYMTPLGLLTEILNLPCPGSAVSGRHALWQRLGLDALDPMDELLNAAQHYAQQEAPCLQGFVEWLMASDSEIKRELDQGGGQVRLMTVHAAKGLEAPIVFLPDTTGVPDTQRMAKLHWSEEEVPCYIPRKPLGGLPMLYWQAMQTRQMEEYRRLLYVAITRAAHHVVLCGWENRKNKNAAHWYALTKTAMQRLVPEQKEDDQALVYTDGEALVTVPKQTVVPDITLALPVWARQVLPPENMPETLRPSTALDDASTDDAAISPDGAYARGRIMHSLLQYLPALAPAERAAAAARYLAEARHNLSPTAQQDIADEILRLFDDPEIAPLFGPQSRAEVPVAGWVKDAPVSGQIDRLCVTDEAVLIIDYKTNRPPPHNVADVPPAYRAQMAAYAALVRQIYPGKPVRSFLLWTHTARLMEITP